MLKVAASRHNWTVQNWRRFLFINKSPFYILPMVVFAMMNKYEYKTMINNMAVYLYFYKNDR